jgi:DNA-binding XRE family transcriptional regulator
VTPSVVVRPPLEGEARGAYRDARGRWRSEGRRLLLLVRETRDALGCALGVTHQTASLLVSGRVRPSLALACKIEMAFGIAPRTWCLAPTIASGACVPTVEGDSTLPIPNATPWTKKALP